MLNTTTSSSVLRPFLAIVHILTHTNTHELLGFCLFIEPSENGVVYVQLSDSDVMRSVLQQGGFTI